jgi:hypothetical protein
MRRLEVGSLTRPTSISFYAQFTIDSIYCRYIIFPRLSLDSSSRRYSSFSKWRKCLDVMTREGVVPRE